MKVLIVKMSSMGDVVHTLPAVTDLTKSLPEVEIDWVVEESFVDIAALHPGINQVIPIAQRRWRSALRSSRKEMADFYRRLKSNNYDVIVDAQGLMKSALVAKIANGMSHGLDRSSAREPLASLLYSNRYQVSRGRHAVERIRDLFAQVFDYGVANLPLNYGVNTRASRKNRRLLFLHGTTWPSKHWPEARWCELAKKAVDNGFDVLLPQGSPIEEQRARRIADSVRDSNKEATDGGNVLKVLASVSLGGLIQEISSCTGVVAVDTGLGHLAVAMNIPMIGIYGSTDPLLTGPYGSRQEIVVSDNLPCIPCLKRECKFQKSDDCSSIYPPCYRDITADMVFERLSRVIAAKDGTF
ncbi:MAG: lipopolysaccharide heptosyltransferase I [bacterium]|nr:lipopolysaccharide heptosyltransferase I [Gammaproteobacteria bacterium]HIL96785.1 lipopolysaccharide heptosyltransferase I [Pseudomonadales bacterium]